MRQDTQGTVIFFRFSSLSRPSPYGIPLFGSHDNQLLRALGNHLTAVLRQDRHILNADAELARQVNAGFRGAHRTHRQGLVIGGIDVGGLVNFQP